MAASVNPEGLTKLIELSVDEFKSGLVSLVSTFLATSAAATEHSPNVNTYLVKAAAEAAVPSPAPAKPFDVRTVWYADGDEDNIQVGPGALAATATSWLERDFSGLLPGQPATGAPLGAVPKLATDSAQRPSLPMASFPSDLVGGPPPPLVSQPRRAFVDGLEEGANVDIERFLEVVKAPSFIKYEHIASAAFMVCGDAAVRVTRPLAYRSASSCVVQCSTRAQALLLRAFLDGLRTDDNTWRIMWVQPLSNAEARCRGFHKDVAAAKRDKKLRNMVLPYVTSALLGGITALCIFGRRDIWKRRLLRVWSLCSWSVQLFGVLFWCRAAVVVQSGGMTVTSTAIDALIACKLALLCLLGLMCSISEGPWLAMPFGVNSLANCVKECFATAKGPLMWKRMVKINIVVPCAYLLLMGLMLGAAYAGLSEDAADRAGIASYRPLIAAGIFMSNSAMAALQLRWQMMCSCGRTYLADIMYRMFNQHVEFKTIRFDFYRIWGVTGRSAMEDRLSTSVACSSCICFVILMIADLIVLLDSLNSDWSPSMTVSMLLAFSLVALPAYGVSYAMWSFGNVADGFSECLHLMMRRHVTIKWSGEDDIDVGVFISYCTSAATLDRHPMCYTMLGLPITKTLLSRLLYAAVSVVATVVTRYAVTTL